MKKRTFYLAMVVISIGGLNCIPVFKTRKEANEYIGDRKDVDIVKAETK